MKIYLLRHFETEGNRLGRYIGKTDYPICINSLNPLMPSEIKNAKTVYISGKLRTRQTAEKLFLYSEFIVENALNEMDFGDFEDKSYQDLQYDKDYIEWIATDCEGKCPNGESKSEFIRRVADRFYDIVNDSIINGEERLCFVVHSGTIKAILSEFGVDAKNYFYYNPPYAGGFGASASVTGERLSLCDITAIQGG